MLPATELAELPGPPKPASTSVGTPGVGVPLGTSGAGVDVVATGEVLDGDVEVVGAVGVPGEVGVVDGELGGVVGAVVGGVSVVVGGVVGGVSVVVGGVVGGVSVVVGGVVGGVSVVVGGLVGGVVGGASQPCTQKTLCFTSLPIEPGAFTVSFTW